MKPIGNYDVVIIGGGIAGLTAAIYTARANLSTIVLEKNACGGLANWATQLENFPSYEKITGMELMDRVKNQVLNLDAEIEEVVEIEEMNLTDQPKIIETDEKTYQAKAIIIATGREPVKLPLDYGCEHVHYCAICDGAAYKGKKVLVVGGGNSGVDDCLYLIQQGVEHITLIEQENRLFASEKAQEKLRCCENVDVMLSTNVCTLEEDGVIKCIEVENVQTKEKNELDIEGVFVYMGQTPQTESFQNIIDVDEAGYILADEDMKTNVPGVLVAGDVRIKKIRQLTTAMNDGTIAAISADAYIRELKDNICSVKSA